MPSRWSPRAPLASWEARLVDPWPPFRSSVVTVQARGAEEARRRAAVAAGERRVASVHPAPTLFPVAS